MGLINKRWRLGWSALSYRTEDLLDVYAVMNVIAGDAEMRQIVLKSVRYLDAGAFLYSTNEDVDKLMGNRKRRGAGNRRHPAGGSGRVQMTLFG